MALGGNSPGVAGGGGGQPISGSGTIRLDPLEAFHRILLEAEIPHRLFYEAVEIRTPPGNSPSSLTCGPPLCGVAAAPSRPLAPGSSGRRIAIAISSSPIVAKPISAAPWLSPQRGRHGPRSAGLDSPQPGWVQLVDQVADGQRLPSGTTFVTRDGFMRERRGGRSIAVANGDFMLDMDAGSRPAARRTRTPATEARAPQQIRTIESERQGHRAASGSSARAIRL